MTQIWLVGWLWAKHYISSGPSANRNSHTVPSGQGAAKPKYGQGSTRHNWFIETSIYYSYFQVCPTELWSMGHFKYYNMNLKILMIVICPVTLILGYLKSR